MTIRGTNLEPISPASSDKFNSGEQSCTPVLLPVACVSLARLGRTPPENKTVQSFNREWRYRSRVEHGTVAHELLPPSEYLKACTAPKANPDDVHKQIIR
jgi:hypothetical protein